MKKIGSAKKKAAAIVAAGMMVMSAMPVMAEQGGNTMSLAYTQDTKYTLSIPATVSLKASAPVTSDPIGLSAVNTKPDEKVQVKVKSGITADNKVVLTRANDSSTTVTSAVTGSFVNGSVGNGSVVAEFQGMDTTTTGTLTFAKIADSMNAAVKAGEYTGTLVFEAAVVPTIGESGVID